MGSYGPNLPPRFPCWVRAVYSWGGENKNDLGFMEGDLIECLNAGDGSWWMGRLRRDRRMMGLFPSNFVEVMDDSFRPPSRSPSPMPGMKPSGRSIPRAASPNPAPPPQKHKTTFRKPYESMRAPSPQPPMSSTNASKPASRANHKQSSLPYPDSTELWNMGSHSRVGSRAPSPSPMKDIGSSPPPPAPPPHRIAVGNRP